MDDPDIHHILKLTATRRYCPIADWFRGKKPIQKVEQVKLEMIGREGPHSPKTNCQLYVQLRGTIS